MVCAPNLRPFWSNFSRHLWKIPPDIYIQSLILHYQSISNFFVTSTDGDLDTVPVRDRNGVGGRAPEGAGDDGDDDDGDDYEDELDLGLGMNTVVETVS